MNDASFTRQLLLEFEIRYVYGDGNCFFRGVALGVTGDEEQYPAVRLAIQRFAQDHPELIIEFYADGELDQMEYDVANLTTNGEFCPGFAPLLASLVYRVNVVIIQPAAQELLWLWSPGDERFETSIFLSYHNQNHYNYLLPRNPQSSSNCLNKSASQIEKPKEQSSSELKCPECPGKTFSTIVALKAHVVRVHLSKKLECELCGKIFKGRALVAHKKNIHYSVPGQFVCDHCGKSFNVKTYLDQHKINVHEFGEYKCTLCPKTFKSPNLCRQHVTNVHGTGKYPCKEEGCGKTFKSKAGLRCHRLAVHGGRRFLCDFCNASFTTKANLNEHRDTVHCTVRKFKCEATEECKFEFKTHRALLKHQRCVHEKERKFVCDVCGSCFWSNFHLHRHLHNIHGVNMTFGSGDQFTCRLCDPPVILPSNATWVFHRLLYHADRLAPGDAKTFNDIYVTTNNRVFFSNEEEFDYCIQNSCGRCNGCNIVFFNSESHRLHLHQYHTNSIVSPAAYTEARQNWLFGNSKDIRKAAHQSLYTMSEQVFPFWDQGRKVYDILITDTPEDQLKNIFVKKDSHFYLYVGGMSIGFGHRTFLVSRHHTTNENVVATNILFKLLNSKEGPKYKAYLVNEKYVDKLNKKLSCRQQLKQQEALDIFTLFWFAKIYNRPDVFFQKLEYGEVMRLLSLEQIIEVMDAVNKCKGNLWDLPRFKPTMFAPIEIYTDGVRESDLQFSRCGNCSEKNLLLSKFHAMKHAIVSHQKVPTTVPEKLIAMPASSRPKVVLSILKDSTTFIRFWVYVVIGSNCHIRTTRNALSLTTEGYVGQCASEVPMSHYHFDEMKHSSGLKKLCAKYKHVYMISSFEFSTRNQMYRAEMALIVQGGLFNQQSDAGKPGIKLINQYTHMHNICELFTSVEWNQLWNPDAGSTAFHLDLPNFITGYQRFDEVQDVTDKIPM